MLNEVISEIGRHLGRGCLGFITKRQTTFLDIALRDAEGEFTVAAYRIHYLKKLEFSLLGGQFRRIALERDHPLGLDYVEPHQGIYFYGSPDDAHGFLCALDEAVRSVFQGWRALDRYLNPCFRSDAALGRARAGRLLVGPRSLVREVVPLAEQHGMRFQVFDCCAGDRSSPWVLLLDRMFVVAEGFRAEPREIAS